MYLSTYIPICLYIQIHMCILRHVWLYAYILTHICMHLYMYVCMCHGHYYPLHRGSSCTGPTAVDREQNTITDVAIVFILDQGVILNSSQSG